MTVGEAARDRDHPCLIGSGRASEEPPVASVGAVLRAAVEADNRHATGVARRAHPPLHPCMTPEVLARGRENDLVEVDAPVGTRAEHPQPIDVGSAGGVQP